MKQSLLSFLFLLLMLASAYPVEVPTLTVPSGTKLAYQSTNYWNNVEAEGSNTSPKQTIHVATAGTLPDLISESEKYTIEELTLTGELNGTDFRLLRDMAGNNYLGEVTQGKLAVLDLSDVKIVVGGEKYLDTESLSGHWSSNGFHYDISQANEIPKYVFCSCSNLTSITLPNSVASIGDRAFSDCSGLTSITIPNSVTYIGWYVFEKCSGLTSVTIGNSVSLICGQTFRYCSGLTSIKVESGNTNYDSRNDCNAIIETWTNTLITGCKNTTIPNSVTSIGEEAFFGCSGLTSITLPNSLTSIGDRAFGNSIDLTSIISEIEKPFEISGKTFSDYLRPILTVPYGTKSAYQSTNYWNMFTNIVEAEGGNTSPKRTIHVATAGTLPDLILESEKYIIEELTLTGELNGTDFRLLRDMAGNNYLGEETQGKLTVLDLSNVKIVVGGEKYLDTDIVNGNGLYAHGNYHYDISQANEIPKFVFNACSALSFITLPNSLTSIGTSAFEFSGLTSVTFPNSLTSIGTSSFSYCENLSIITLPNSVTSIGHAAFERSGLYSITFPNSLTSIDSGVFRDCERLKSIVLPDSLTSIGESAFYGCVGFNSITLPNSVTTIGNCAFAGCSGLTSIKVESGNTKFDSRDDCNAIIETATNTLIAGCINTTIPNSVTSIGQGAFENFWSLTSITIPNSVTSIGELAFQGCRNLTSITLSNSVTSIGFGTFNGCSGLTSITLPNSVTSIGYGAFKYCYGLTSVVSEIEIPFEISENTFSDYSKPTLTVPRGTKSLYQSTNYWNMFTNIVEAGGGNTSPKRTIHVATAGTISDLISESDKYIIEELTLTGELNGTDFRLLRDMAGNNYLGEITDGKMKYLDLSEVKIVSGGEKYLDAEWIKSSSGMMSGGHYETQANIIGDFLFAACSSLSTIILPNNVTSIEGSAFSHCSGLTSIMIPNSVTGIGDWAFSGCSGLTSIKLPNSVMSIGKYAFSHCSGLTSIMLPNSVTSIGWSPFANCSGLTSIKVESENAKYDSRNDCNAIIETWTNILIAGCKNSTIPNTVGCIGDYAFEGCTGLTSITLPKPVTRIGDRAFKDCSGLTSITFPNLWSIGSYAFEGCTGLTSITLPNSLSRFEKCPFYKCSGLTSIVSEIEKPFETSGDVVSDYSKPTLIVPRGTKPLYLSTYFWNKFENIVEAEEDNISPKQTIHVATAGTLSDLISESEKYTIEELTLTGELNGTDFRLLRDMAGNNYLGEVTQGKLSVLDLSDVKIVVGGEKYLDTESLSGHWSSNGFHYDISQANEIPKYVFCSCSSLTSITLPNSVTSIGESAFSECSGLTSITIPNSVTYIGESAFSDCKGLTDVYCYAKKVPETSNSAFLYSHIEDAKLHVPATSLELYMAEWPWYQFGTIVALDGSSPEEPETPKCAKPTISYANGEIEFDCETEGVEYISEVTVDDAKKCNDSTVSLTQTYKVSVYAVKTGYENSDTTTAEIRISCALSGDTNGDGVVNAADIVEIVNIIMKQ